MSLRQRHVPPPLHEGCAVFLDIDGTLLEIAPSPELVKVAPTLLTLLPALRRRLGGAVALITGRGISDVDRLFAGIRMPIAGQHGSERRDALGTLHLHAKEGATLERLRSLFTEFARRHEGLMLEDKGATLALHYRRAPHLAAHVHRTMRETVESTGTKAYRLQPGKCLLELRLEGRDKGAAIADFMAEKPFRGRCPVFIGDDLGDEHGFKAVERLGGWTIKVGGGRSLARYRLADVKAVLGWLATPLGPAPT
jgi:trehalose 6-phosphate phosphatase